MRLSFIVLVTFGQALALAETNKQIDQYQAASQRISGKVAAEVASIETSERNLLRDCKEFIAAQTDYGINEKLWANLVKADALKLNADSVKSTLLGQVNEAIAAMTAFAEADAKLALEEGLPVAQRQSLLAITRFQAPLPIQFATFNSRYTAYKSVVDNIFKNDTVIANSLFQERIAVMLKNLREMLKVQFLDRYALELLKAALSVPGANPVAPSAVITSAMKEAAQRRWPAMAAKHVEWNQALGVYKNAMAGLVPLPNVAGSVTALCNFLNPPSTGNSDQ